MVIKYVVKLNNLIFVEDEDGGLRHFKSDLAADEEMLLPIKVDGKVVKRVRKIEAKEEEPVEVVQESKKSNKEEDLSGLSAIELISKRREMLENIKDSIASLSLALTSDPHQNVRLLYE